MKLTGSLSVLLPTPRDPPGLQAIAAPYLRAGGMPLKPWLQNCSAFGGILAIGRTMKMQAECSRSGGRGSATTLPVWATALAALGFLAVAAVYVFCITFNQFRLYDDEGYLMICVQGFLEGNPLFSAIGTCYGPLYFFYEWLAHGLVSLPLTHDATRLLCVTHWLVAATILSLAGWRLTRSLPVAFFVFAQSVVHLETMAGEPGHPQEIVVVLLALAALVAAQGTARRRTLLVLGAIGACLVFTKINVGAFFMLALVLSLLCHTELSRSRAAFFLVLIPLIGFVPFFLMRQHLSEAWAAHYCWQACAGIMAVGMVAHAYARRREIGLGQWIGTGLSFATLAGLFLAIVLLTGSSLSALADSLVKVPASLADAFCVPLHVEHCSWSAVGALALAILVVGVRGHMDRWLLPIAFGKAVYGVIGGVILVQDPHGQLGYLLPWVWILLIPPGNDKGAKNAAGFSRSVLCLMAVWQGLQAYPVGCTQAAIGTFLAVLIYAVCAYDALETLAPVACLWLNLKSWHTRRAVLLSHGGFIFVLFAVFVFKWTMPLEHWRYYAAVPPMRLHGAHLVRPEPAQANKLRMLTEYIQSECDTFVALPGLNSLYFWTGKRPPTYLSLNGEGIMPSDEQQDHIVAALRRAKRPLVIEREKRRAPGIRVRETREGPLPLVIRNEYREVARFADFRVLAPQTPVGYQSASSGR